MLVLTDRTAVQNQRHEKSLRFAKMSLSMCTCAALAVAPRYNIRAVLPRLSRAPVGSPPGYKLLPQEVVFLCCISQGARLFRRQCYQPTFPILLTYPPRYLRLSISPFLSVFLALSYIQLWTQSLYSISWTLFSKLFSTFSPSPFLGVFYILFFFISSLFHPLRLLFSFFFTFPVRVI